MINKIIESPEFINYLSKLHPAKLAILILRIQAAKEIRYNAPHPDYYIALRTCLGRERQPGQPFARFTEKDANRIIDDLNRHELSKRLKTGTYNMETGEVTLDERSKNDD